MSEESKRDNHLGVDVTPYNDESKYPVIESRIITSMNEHLISCNPRMVYVKPKIKEIESQIDSESIEESKLESVFQLIERVINEKFDRIREKQRN